LKQEPLEFNAVKLITWSWGFELFDQNQEKKWRKKSKTKTTIPCLLLLISSLLLILLSISWPQNRVSMPSLLQLSSV